MQPEIDRRLLELDRSLSDMISLLDGLDHSTLHRKPGGKWSPAQVFQHLHDSENGTVAYLAKKLSTPADEVPKGGMGSVIRSKLLKRALRNKKKKYHAPKALGDVDPEPNYPVLRTDYLEIRKKMRSMLEKTDDSKMKRAYFKHPVAGRLTILQMLGFLEDHFDRHFEQIKERSK